MSTPWALRDVDVAGLTKLASFLALVLKAGDVISLSGELGAGKTTFARALIGAALDDPALEIPSPTFALMHLYEEGRLPLAHIDCYRLEGAEDAREVGLEAVLGEGAAIIEWAERVPGILPEDHLEIAIRDGAHDELRILALTGHGAWRERLSRLRAMMAFCDASPWAGAKPVFLQGDASSRAYARLHRNGESAILMDAPARGDGPPLRDGMPYSALVHLAEDVAPFVAVASALERAGVAVPRIFAHDLTQGFLIIEDLGNRVFVAEPGQTPPLEELYQAATDVLVALRAHPPAGELPVSGGGTHAMPHFDARAFEIEADLLLEWFYPAVHGRAAPDDVRGAFHVAFGALFEALEGQDESWVLRDYHSPNLIWLPERTGLARVGVIDFQDAVIGHSAYDLVSLLQDARRDIAASLEGRLLLHYCEACEKHDSQFNKKAFATAYATLGAQRNTKILGIFARLAKRDAKQAYLAHIPRVSAYLERNLEHPALGDLRDWFDANLPAALRTKPLNI